jgi:endonuclease/exonuclease/phosphatase family metal-dependent hydrolase
MHVRPDPRRSHALEHSLGPMLDRLAAIPHRRALRRDPEYRRLEPEIVRVTDGCEWDLRPTLEPRPAPERLGVVAWNVERGKRIDGVLAVMSEHERLREADLHLLTEVDIGVGRSGNRNVPRELAESLGCGYVYCNMDLLLSPGDAFERDHLDPNDLALHGCALLTRWPVTRFECVPLIEYRDKFHDDEKRLGGKRALVCEVELPGGPLTVAVTHLDPFAPPRHRGRQMRRVLRAVQRMGHHRALVGGDWNTNTYDFGTTWGLCANIAHKLMRFGFAGTIEQYMTPEQVFERHTFAVLEQAGFEIDPYNDRSLGTAYYDLQDPELDDWTRRYIPGFAHRWLRKQLEPWNHCVPLRIDWLAGRGLRPTNPAVIHRPAHQGHPVSDHDPVLVDLEWP